MMRKLMILSGVPLMALALWSCEIEKKEEGALPKVDVDVKQGQLPKYEVRQTQEGKMPDVDVNVQKGKLPEYEVKGPDVEIGKKEVTVPVPNVEIKKEEKQITVPTVDIKTPAEQEAEKKQQ